MPAELIELVVDIAPRGSMRWDYENAYEDKARIYAKAGIPVYAVFDFHRAACTVLHTPGPEGYKENTETRYGTEVTLATALGDLGVDTAELPVDPGAEED